MDHLTEQDAGLLEQAATMLEEHAEEQRTRGNCSAAEGAACSADAIRRLAPAMLRAAGRSCLAQIEEPATLAGTTIAQYARMFNAACEALGQISDCLGINSDINPGAEPIIAAIEQMRAGGAPVFDGCWKARMLDGRAIERDAQGLGEHPDLPWLDEGMNPPKFFEALGLQLAGVSAQDQLDVDAYDAMAGNYDAKEFNFSAWAPASPEGAGWCLVSIHDTEDGPAAWWLREQPYVAATRPVRRARERDDLTLEECREYLHSGWTRVRGRTEQALMLQLCEALEAGTAPAAGAGPAWDKTRDSLATLLLGLARRPFLDFDVACIALDAATEPGMPLAYMRSAAAAPTLEARASDLRNAATQALADLERAAGHISSAVALRAALEAPAAPGTPPLTPDEARWAARSADRMRGPSDVTSGTEYAMAGAMALAKKLAAAPQAPAAPSADEREAFEAWIKKDGGDLSTFGSGQNRHYNNSAVNNAWTGWSSRAAQAAPAAPAGVVGWVKDECTGPGAFDPMFVRGAAPLPAGYVANYRPVVYAAAPDAPAVDATSDTALLDAMQRHRIALVPEFEGPWDAEIYDDDAEARHIASGNTPREALRAAIAAQAKEGGEA